jgi:3-oxoacyl-(acyl-carrier-protein) synthase
MSGMAERPVVITGIGPLSPHAASRTELWRLFHEHDGAPARAAATARHLAELPPAAGQFRQMDALGRFVLTAVALALEDARLELEQGGDESIGIAFGSGYGCLAANAEYLEGIRVRGARYGNPVVFQNTVPNAAAGYASAARGVRGPTATFSSGWTAGLEALDFAFLQIASGRVPTMIVVSADQLFPQLVAGFEMHRQLSPTGIPRPLDRRRDGTALSEGACALILEDADAARARGARAYAELLSVGHAGDGGGDPARALASAVDEALGSAGLAAGDLQAVFSCASGSRETDRWESAGLAAALGAHAAQVPTTCPKALLGETLGSGGTFAAGLAALSLDSGWFPPTAHYVEADPDRPQNVQSPRARRLDAQTALVPALGEGGSALAAVLRRCAS